MKRQIFFLLLDNKNFLNNLFFIVFIFWKEKIRKIGCKKFIIKIFRLRSNFHRRTRQQFKFHSINNCLIRRLNFPLGFTKSFANQNLCNNNETKAFFLSNYHTSSEPNLIYDEDGNFKNSTKSISHSSSTSSSIDLFKPVNITPLFSFENNLLKQLKTSNSIETFNNFSKKSKILSAKSQASSSLNPTSNVS